MADLLLPPQKPASPERRRLLRGLALAPLTNCLPVSLHAPSTTPPLHAMSRAVDLRRMETAADFVRIFDAVGRLRVVFGRLPSSP